MLNTWELCCNLCNGMIFQSPGISKSGSPILVKAPLLFRTSVMRQESTCSLSFRPSLSGLELHICRLQEWIDGGRLELLGWCRCLDPMLTIVSALAYGRSMFVSPPDRRDEANAAKRQLSEQGAAAKSDHLTIVVAFNKWHQERLLNGPESARQVSSYIRDTKP